MLFNVFLKRPVDAVHTIHALKGSCRNVQNEKVLHLQQKASQVLACKPQASRSLGCSTWSPLLQAAIATLLSGKGCYAFESVVPASFKDLVRAAFMVQPRSKRLGLSKMSRLSASSKVLWKENVTSMGASAEMDIGYQRSWRINHQWGRKALAQVATQSSENHGCDI